MMIKMETWFNSYGKREEDFKVRDCKKGDDLPFEKMSPSHIWGWIDFRVDDTLIMTEGNYDYIIILWELLAQEVCNSELLTKKFTIHFPDTKQRFEFNPIDRDKVEVSLYDSTDERTAVADKKELIKEVIREGTAFFTKIKEILPSEVKYAERFIKWLEILKLRIEE